MLLGDFTFQPTSFPELEELLKPFLSHEFKKLNKEQRSLWVNRTLLEQIQAAEIPCFLLPAVLEWIDHIAKEKILPHYTFAHFELFLNQSSSLTLAEQLQVRAKIVGKQVERYDYQLFFPIGMAKTYEGSHIVTAHRSPDLDTTVASFWGWMDAFAARVSGGVHTWNIPDAFPACPEIELLFTRSFGKAILTRLPQMRSTLSLTSTDLLNRRDLHYVAHDALLDSVDHGRNQKAIVVVDREGFYLGDWRSIDVEGVRQVLTLFYQTLHYFEHQLTRGIVQIFTDPLITKDLVISFLKELLHMPISSSSPVEKCTGEQRSQFDLFLLHILDLSDGIECSFYDFYERFSLGANFAQILTPLFDERGYLLEDRSQLFTAIHHILNILQETSSQLYYRLEQFGVAIAIKEHVLGHKPHCISLQADLEEIRDQMGSYSYLTVVQSEDQRLIPIGVIYAQDLQKPKLATVSLRDFCNSEEIGIPSYFEVISVIDHHKASLTTSAPSVIAISDAQSSNALVADRTFQINDRYSLGGLTSKQIRSQLSSATSPLVIQRLLQRQRALEKQDPYFVHPAREWLEYLHFLYAIFDDTDLLSKVSPLDLEVVASLLNRMKSLLLEKEVEMISLEALPRDSSFIKKAARVILQNEDAYSLYRKVFEAREEEVTRQLHFCAQSKPCNLFSDTKEQNGCCRIGQTKLFKNNIPVFSQYADTIRKIWLDKAQAISAAKKEIDLHLQMISTIASAEEALQGSLPIYNHQDELWLWASPVGSGHEHLRRFLTAFRHCPGLANNPLEITLPEKEEELAQIFQEIFPDAHYSHQQSVKNSLPMAILRFRASSLNSRKAMISPFLPIETKQ